MRLARIAWLFATAALVAPAPALGADYAFSPVVGSPFEMNSDPGDVIVADIDADGFPDAVLGDAFGPTITIFWGQSGGTFGSANETELDTAGAASHLVVADLDNDTDLDIAGAGVNLQIFKRNNGSPRTFTAGAAQTLDTEDDLPFVSAEGMVAGNFDGGADTDLDLAVSVFVSGSSSPTGGAVRIFENDPTGTFTHDANIYKVSDYVGELVVGTFNADSDPDLAFIRHDDNPLAFESLVSLRMGASQRTFAAESTITVPLGNELAVADLDEDPHDDIVLSGSVNVLWGKGDGTFDPLDEVSSSGDFFADLFFGDFNNDGRRDIGLSGSPLTVLTNQGARAFTVGATYLGRDEDFGFYGAAADLGGDARDDLIIGTFFYFCAYLTVDPIPAPDPGRCGPPPEPPPDDGGDPPPGDNPPSDPPSNPTSGPLSNPPFNPPLTQPVIPVRANQIATLPSNRKCVSRRNFRIRLRRPPGGVTVSNATVLVNGKRVKTLRGARLTAPVDLRGIPKGKVTVTIRIVLGDGRVLRGRRVYRTCATKKRGSKRFPKSRG